MKRLCEEVRVNPSDAKEVNEKRKVRARTKLTVDYTSVYLSIR